MTLYELQNQQLELNALLEEMGGELTPEIEEKLTIHENEIQNKMESYCKAIRCYESDIDGIKSEMERLKARKESSEKAVQRMKEAMLNAMTTFGMDKIQAGTFKIGTRKSQSLDVLDEALVPDKFKSEVTTIKVDKNAIKDAIKNGEQVEGVKLNDNTNLTIK